MAIQHKASLLLGATGTVCDVWDGYHVVTDLTQSGNPWTFTLWRSASGDSAWSTLKEQARNGDWIIFSIDDAPQLAGRIDLVDIGANHEQGATLVLNGQDLAGRAIKWDADPRISYRSTVLEDALRALFQPLGIDVVIGALGSEARSVQMGRLGIHAARGRRSRRQKVDKFHPKLGEKVWSLAETMCRKAGLMMWIAPAALGKLAVVIDLPDYKQPTAFSLTRIERDGSVPQECKILDGRIRTRTDDVPTDVFVVARGARGDSLANRVLQHIDNHGTIADFVNLATFGNQPRWIESTRAHDPATAQQDGDRVIADAMRDLRLYHCDVQGHGQIVNGAMRLYAINTIAHVKDTVTGVDEDMLIQRVEMIGSRAAGQMSKLTLHPMNAIQLTPEPEAA